jgi:hypothetical protein
MSDLPQFRPCALTDLANMDYSFAQGELPGSQHPTLVVSLSGVASNASDEMGIYDYASAIIMAGLEAWQPSTLVLDLRAFEYSWGDRMSNVLGAAQHWFEAVYPMRVVFCGPTLPRDFPVAVITSAVNHKGLLSLLTDYLHKDPSALLYASLGDAVRALDARMADVPLM